MMTKKAKIGFKTQSIKDIYCIKIDSDKIGPPKVSFNSP